MNEAIDIKIVGTETEFSQAMGVRRSVFIEECKIPEGLEFDGNDYSSTHVVALYQGKAVGTMRIRYFNGFVKFERMCVLPEFRKTDISEHIMRRGSEFVAMKGFDKVYGVCKLELLKRWQEDGFVKIPAAEPVNQNGMTLIPICRTLQRPKNYITMQTPAEVLNAKEGEWNVLKPSHSAMNQRLTQMMQQVKLLKCPFNNPNTNVSFDRNFHAVFLEH